MIRQCIVFNVFFQMTAVCWLSIERRTCHTYASVAPNGNAVVDDTQIAIDDVLSFCRYARRIDCYETAERDTSHLRLYLPNSIERSFVEHGPQGLIQGTKMIISPS